MSAFDPPATRPRVLAPPARPPRPVSFDASWRHEARIALQLFACALAWFAFTAWLRPLAIPDEGRYVGVAREMLLAGQWRVPTLDGLPFFHKPPLFYWLTAASMQVFGLHAAAARGASILAAAITVTGLHAFVRRWHGGATARRVVLVLATLPLFYAGAQFANPDLLVAACISGAVLAASHAVLARETGAAEGPVLAAAFLFAALGLLSKGLIGVVLPVGVLLAWGLGTRRLGTVLGALAWWPGWLLFMLVGAPWFVAVQAQYPGFAHYFFVVQHFDRFLSHGFNNGQPVLFYVAVLAVLGLPWSPWLAALLRADYWRRPDPNGLRALMLSWLGVVTVFFSIPHSKLVGYILPALPPFAFLVADAWRHASSRVRTGAPVGFRAATRTAAAVCLGLAVVAHFLQPKSTAELGGWIADARRPGEPVYLVGNPYFDLPFYAGIEIPVRVVDGWSAADLAQDTWRSALADAASFAPAGSDALMKPEQLKPALCAAAGSWVVAPETLATSQLLARLTPVFASRGVAAWHVLPSGPARERLCAN